MMTQEEKAKRYEEALERANIIYTDEYKPEIAEFCKQSLENIFPELKESEDERIRKAILEGLIDCRDAPDLGWSNFGGIEIDDCIAWLEKQGEQKPQGKTALEAIKEEKVDNQNCVKPADKSKFKVGDWIVTPINKVLQITSIEGTSYRLNNESSYWEIYYCDKECHLWTIQDAKDGDVLASKDGGDIVIFRNLDSSTSFSSYYNINRKGEFGWSNNRFIPTTKVQRDALFARMKEAGYEWNADKKELKKEELK